MKLEEVRNAYQEYTGIVSQLIRSISLAGIAVAWIVRLGESKDTVYAESCDWVFLLLILALSFDLLQYITQAATWGLFNYHHQKKGTNLSDEVEAPAWFNNIPIAFWIAKTGLSISGVIVLAHHLAGQIFK
jgi:hypothetical protein